VAVLCNTTGTNPAGYAHQVADLFLASRVKELPQVKPVPVPEEELVKLAGLYREKATDAVLRVTYDSAAKAVRAGGPALVATGASVLSTSDGGRTYTFDAAPGGVMRITEGDGGRSKPRVWEREPEFKPTPKQLAAFAGDYVCEELGGLTYTVYLEGESLKARARPAQRLTLLPAFPDGFVAAGNTIRFTRNPKGLVEGFRVYAGRVRNLRFAKR
jgi:hypothetical protein